VNAGVGNSDDCGPHAALAQEAGEALYVSDPAAHLIGSWIEWVDLHHELRIIASGAISRPSEGTPEALADPRTT
jgi:hypothetical protein